MAKAAEKPETRTERRQRRNREALIDACHQVMSEKGYDAATMQEIADLADVGAGTVYNYYASKEDLAIAALEKVIHQLAVRIQAVTDTFSDPAQVYAFGVRAAMTAASQDIRWRQLLNRSEVIADVMYRITGPFAIRDIQNAVDAGRFKVDDPALAWRMATHAIIGFSLAVTRGQTAPKTIDEAVVNLLSMVGVKRDQAWELANRKRPKLPPE